jgi:hypothetical protein
VRRSRVYLRVCAFCRNTLFIVHGDRLDESTVASISDALLVPICLDVFATFFLANGQNRSFYFYFQSPRPFMAVGPTHRPGFKELGNVVGMEFRAILGSRNVIFKKGM